MAQIEILGEEDRTAGWVFEAQILDAEGGLHPVRLTLAWADFNLWSPDGADEPQKVAEAVLGFLASQIPVDEIPPRLDAAAIRRTHADADRLIPRFIRDSF